jgi:LPS export ABC transporter protein LptC
VLITKYKILCLPLAFLVGGILFSCVNDLDTIKKISYKSSDPDERTRDLNVFYTDSGYAKIEVYAKIAETYSKPESVVKIKDGLKVTFFDSNGDVVSVLTAINGEIYQRKGLIIVRDSVQLFNEQKNQRLETEELFWNQVDEQIYTEQEVVIRTSDALFFGEGLKTKQDFTTYEFLKPKGKIKLKNK